MHPSHPQVHTIAAGVPFLPKLAELLLTSSLPALRYRDPGDPTRLANVELLLPTRRACRAIRMALLNRSPHQSIILPRIRAIGDIDVADFLTDPELAADYPDPGLVPQLPPELSGLERLLLLTRLVQYWGEASAQSVLNLDPRQAPLIPGSTAMATRLARELARLMDQLENDEISLAQIAELVPDHHAQYWNMSVDFLKILGESWPRVLAEHGALSPVARRRALTDAETRRLAKQIDRPVIAAGSTGSLPSTARLLMTVAQLDHGTLILPGMDPRLDDENFEVIEQTPSHPFHTMAQLLGRLNLGPCDLIELGDSDLSSEQRARRRLLRETMRPEQTSQAWRDISQRDPGLAAATDHLTLIDADNEHQEALAIALVLRQVLETDGKTAALVTPDRQLARRVEIEMRRWGVQLDDSAGVPLSLTRPATLARHIVELSADSVTPVPLLELLKHANTHLNMPTSELRGVTMALERGLLRGPRPDPSFDGMRGALNNIKNSLADRSIAPRSALTEDMIDALTAFLDRIEAALEPWLSAPDHADLQELAARHQQAYRNIIKQHEFSDGPATAFATAQDAQAEQELTQLYDEIAAASTAIGSWKIAKKHYPALFAEFAAERPVRGRPQHSSRLNIWGPLEARLMHVDLMILGGLNEGKWPSNVTTDPWLSRRLRGDLGLTPLEQRIGLGAHDVVQAASGPEIIFTRALKSQGEPTIASRWLQRLWMVVDGIDDTLLAQLRQRGAYWTDLARRLDRPAQYHHIAPPAPSPPVAARPRHLSVTDIERLIRDPYAIYAAHILKLRPLPELDAPLGASERGQIVHQAMHLFLFQPGPHHHEQGYQRLCEIGWELFERLPESVEVKAFWWERFQRIARWITSVDTPFAAGDRQHLTEISGKLSWLNPAVGLPFTLRCRADRIDIAANGHIHIYDYKTGIRLPSKNQIASGIAPQLPLEAAIAIAGGFEGVAPAPISELALISLTGGQPPGQFYPVDHAPIDEIAADALEQLKQRWADYDDPKRPYHPKLAVMFERETGDYDHLARVKEWQRNSSAPAKTNGRAD